MGKHLGRFRVFDSLGVRDRSADELETRLREQQFNSGSNTYVLSLPASAEYEGEDAGDMIRIYSVGTAETDNRTFVCGVPSGSYRIENDDAGAHLYRMSDEPERQPLSDTPINLFGTDGMTALTRMQDRLANHYRTSGPEQSVHVMERDLTGRLDDSTTSDALAHINRRNQAVWGGR